MFVIIVESYLTTEKTRLLWRTAATAGSTLKRTRTDDAKERCYLSGEQRLDKDLNLRMILILLNTAEKVVGIVSLFSFGVATWSVCIR